MTTPYVGQIMMFGGTFAISNWAFCDGSLMSIAQNDVLYSLIGTTYGGDGQTTFALPNLQSRVAINQGAGAGLSNYVLGQAAGTETVTLNSQQIPPHPHAFVASSTPAVSGGQTPGTALIPGTASQSNGHLYVANDGTSPPPTSEKLADFACGQAGGSQPHNNLMPTLCVTYLIALNGIYPSRN